MIHSLVAMYEKGAITADHLIVQSLTIIDPADPASVLSPLPKKILTRMHDLTRKFQPGRLVSNYGPLPTVEQLEAAMKWIEAASRPASATSSKA